MVASIDNLSGQVVESACDTVLYGFLSRLGATPRWSATFTKRDPQLKIILIGWRMIRTPFLKAIHLGPVVMC